MLAAGDRIPAAQLLWRAPGEEAVSLAEAIAGDGLALVCFYPFDWSPT